MPLHLPFDESGLEASINEARDEVAKLSDNQALGYTVINGGKSIIKANGLSTDAWTQMIIQLAYSRLVAIEGSEMFQLRHTKQRQCVLLSMAAMNASDPLHLIALHLLML
ncbi:hypothetical protein WALSEDRAFT_59023 [Wallemia mellicola CBS 633.66]|uniref:Choline/carnitine acyltransferase domain-containing protein n=1 Tax=Wallemia mellicola (strain ATCC MYA-4683 / CBS 633.66) TaxID=671144 RepID=I4YJ08_WALMC|nr:hypothetical protein WALSEDRAFT_59023 [Wallemia mellicola CBS 633.66]EIM23950.1 hypothetical protein WALSEDRAFT_59023 [Wallemia mellicola CBS 633.66]|eukprot:XP_006955788.1 hypothetical protein WALSEDRAFT_59023 [Wallemia mellicola CBS 633.66]